MCVNNPYCIKSIISVQNWFHEGKVYVKRIAYEFLSLLCRLGQMPQYKACSYGLDRLLCYYIAIKLVFETYWKAFLFA